MIRLFVGIGLNKQIKDELFKIRNEVNFCKASWARYQNLHLTVKYLGNTREDMIGKVKNAIGNAIVDFKPFELYLDRLGSFPCDDKAHIFWAGVSGDINYFENLEKSIQNSVTSFGYKRDKRPFHPHITLAHLRMTEDITEAIKIPIPKLRIEVNELTLFQSRLDFKGAEYTCLKKFELKA